MKPIKIKNTNRPDLNFVDSTELVTTNISGQDIQKGILRTDIIARNGLFNYTESLFGWALRPYAGDYAGTAIDGVDYEPYLELSVEAPKIPKEVMDKVIAWYDHRTKTTGSEAQVVFYWNRDKVTTIDDQTLADIPGVEIIKDDLFLYVPKQENSGALTQVSSKDTWYDRFNNAFGFYIETHSHNSMAAFMSQTDLNNSLNDGIQLVFGEFASSTYTTVPSYSFGRPKAKPQPVRDGKHTAMHSWATINQAVRESLTEDELTLFLENTGVARNDGQRIFTLATGYDFTDWDAQIVKDTTYRFNSKFATSAKPAYKTISTENLKPHVILSPSGYAHDTDVVYADYLALDPYNDVELDFGFDSEVDYLTAIRKQLDKLGYDDTIIPDKVLRAVVEAYETM